MVASESLRHDPSPRTASDAADSEASESESESEDHSDSVRVRLAPPRRRAVARAWRRAIVQSMALALA